MLATFEERRDAHYSNVVVPHYNVLFIFAWDFEGILEYYDHIRSDRSLKALQQSFTFEGLSPGLA